MEDPIPQAASPVAGGARRKALLLTYRFPPAQASSIASRRAEGLHRHLREFGWDTTVFTTHSVEGDPDVIAVEDKSFAGARERSSGEASGKKSVLGKLTSAALNAVKPILRLLPCYMDAYALWCWAAAGAAMEYAKEHRVDLVWATLSPGSLGWAAVALAKRLKVPCVLDFRDPPGDYYNGTLPWLTRAIQGADAITVAAGMCVTPYLRRNAKNAPLVVLSGTWHEQPIEPERSPLFRIVSAGTWHAEFDISHLLSAMQRLSVELPEFKLDARLVFIGRSTELLRSSSAFAAAAEMIEVKPPLPYDATQAELRRASILLIVRSDSLKPGAIGGKLYDYIALRLPILSLDGSHEPHGALVDWIGGSKWTDNPDKIYAFLREQYLGWKAQGTTRVERNTAALEYLSQRRMAAEMATVFDAILGKQPVSTRVGSPWPQ